MLKLEEGNLNSSFNNFQNYGDHFSEIEDDSRTSQHSLPKESPAWDAFTYFPLKKESASMQNKKWADISIQIIKVLVYIVLFCIVLCSGLLAKFMTLLAISQLGENNTVPFCDYFSEYDEQLGATISKKGKIVWIWYIIFMFLIPESLALFRAIWCFLFKKKGALPRKQSIIILCLLETLHPIGVALLIFYSLPRINSADAAAISTCVCFIPALLNLISQCQKHTSTIKTFLLVLSCNILAVVAQGSGVFLQSFLNYNIQDPEAWILPVALVLSSCRWWSNYVSHYNYYGFMKYLANVKADLINNYNVLQGYVAVWRSFIFISSAITISLLNEIKIQELFQFSWESEYNVKLIENSNSFSGKDAELVNWYFRYDDMDIQYKDSSTPYHTFLVQAFCSFLLYETAKFAYQTQMHQFGFALPLSLITPGTISLILIFGSIREQDSCAFHEVIPDHLFLNLFNYNNITEFLLSWRLWCWFIWWLSQIWITFQAWLGENERLAPIEKIFQHSSYDTFLTDQFLALNKRRHENNHNIEKKDEEEDHLESPTGFETYSLKETQTWNSSRSSISNTNISTKMNSSTTQIYACATMWHETKEEMRELIGSILRLDKDQCAMKVTQKYYKIYIKDYYELETHVMFDDAFCCIYGCIEPCDHDDNETQVNQYVITFVDTMQESIRNLGILALPPIKCPTPYGGQLIWNLHSNVRWRHRFSSNSC